VITDQHDAPAYLPPKRPTDGVSIAALVTGVIGLGVVPVVLGALGLHRTRGGHLGGRGLAIAGLVLGVLQTLAYAGFALLLVLGGWGSLREGFTDGWQSAAESSADAPTTVFGADELTLGDCLVEDGGMAGADVEVVDCADAHDAEVLDVVTTTATGDYPGDDPMAAEADTACSASLDAQLAAAGLPADGLWYGWYTPSEATWADGDREIDCLLYAESEDGTLTGSLAQGTLVVDGSGSAV